MRVAEKLDWKGLILQNIYRKDKYIFIYDLFTGFVNS
jgi:hypothetical protein